MTANRIAVVGPVASGKTTFGRTLSQRLGLPFVDLDDLYWRRDPVPSDAEWAEIHGAAVAQARWVMAGDYRALAPARFAAADAVVWLDPPRWRCAVRAIRRKAHGYPAPLPDCLRWIWRYRRHGCRETASALADLPATVTVLHLRSARDRRRDVRSFG